MLLSHLPSLKNQSGDVPPGGTMPKQVEHVNLIRNFELKINGLECLLLLTLLLLMKGALYSLGTHCVVLPACLA